MASMGEWVWFLLRWIHFLAGITWIGLLYYFNFVQVPFFAETEPGVRSGAQQKLLPRALWWFRWAAMITFLSGWLYLLGFSIQKNGFAVPGTWGIFLGGLLGSIMWANVWFIIWPKNKIVIQNALDTAAGKPANPAAAAAGARGGLASRTNVLFSIPMLFFMGTASHMPWLPVPWSGLLFWVVALAIMVLVEVNALVGTPGKGAAKPLATVKGTLWAGFILTLVYYLWFVVMQAR
ncbi:MAG TPA: urate hydroxylase PuuD [Methylomirabilota bacterium]|nr:urate hydroxylase PuuD [Methylomirabilota bacterium]